MTHSALHPAIALLAALALCLYKHRLVPMANSEGLVGAPGFARFTIGLVAVTGIAASLLALAIASCPALPSHLRALQPMDP